ncbi:hypothetical protein CJJ23_01130 [Mycoplasmopsis agassizii]|uniref:Uncharacterized protein n=1 Tax=Mycoplasmopsis agassizii TaxID=33922 RepID=A0A269TJ96_9BACT|nr:hypothetical protein [Mycoplasmopsis agassizii]PAK21539.1 hypothetical protein CJJ23_01130 [Mycoplasmopsis agassizii]
MNNNQKGYLYILKNKGWQKDYLKIESGKTLPDLKSEKYLNTDNPSEFYLFITLRTAEYKDIELFLSILLSLFRTSQNSNIYKVTNETILKTIDILSQSYPNIEFHFSDEFLTMKEECQNQTDLIENSEDDEDDDQEEQNSVGTKAIERSERFDFHSKGIKTCDKIQYIYDESLEIIVVSDRKVYYNNQLWTTSGLAKKLLKKKSADGPAYFKFNGKILREIPNNNQAGLFKRTTTKEIEITYDKTDEFEQNSNRFNFYSRGLKNGDLISFLHNESIQPIVISEHRVSYEENNYTLTGLVRKLLNNQTQKGPEYFKYKGVLLNDLEQVSTNKNTNYDFSSTSSDEKSSLKGEQSNSSINAINTQATAGPNNIRSTEFDLYARGLKNGDIITFKFDESKKAKVVSQYHVEHENRIATPSTFARIFLTLNGWQNVERNGSAYFLYNGKFLKDLDFVSNKNKKPKIVLKERINFYILGLKNGDLITFVKDENIKPKIVSSFEVEWDNKIWSTSGLAKELLPRYGYKRSERQGPAYFKVKGVLLSEMKPIK